MTKKSNPEELLVLYGVYTKLIEAIKHFDGIQTSYRTLASTLLLASFAAMGFVFSPKAIILPFNRLIAVMIIAILALGILTAVFCVDLLFQERLLIGNFVEALKLEKEHEWLPKVHVRMINKGSHVGSPSRKVVFYIGCNSCLIFILGISAAFLINGSNLSYFFVFFVTLVFIFGNAFLLRKSCGKFEDLVQKLLKSRKMNE